MYKKAEMFGDEEAMKEVLATHDPRKQKAIGRKVKNFDADKWNTACRQIVEYANYMKFTQNRVLMVDLLALDLDTVLVEASPFDKIWGIGLSEDDEDCLDRDKWCGTNWLGQAITNVRDRIVKDLDYWKTEIRGN